MMNVHFLSSLFLIKLKIPYGKQIKNNGTEINKKYFDKNPIPLVINSKIILLPSSSIIPE